MIQDLWKIIVAYSCGIAIGISFGPLHSHILSITILSSLALGIVGFCASRGI